ncbi:MAG: hypothetical protein CMC08_08820 [Flavobacteriaceae bacterium]|nr:hypothetical protein [Flavobacteriaceae bacterium]
MSFICGPKLNIMKFYYAFALLLLVNLSAFSQVGINTTTPHPSSILEIASDTKGVLMPRVPLLDANGNPTIANPVDGLLVYNTYEGNGFQKGFYFYGNNDWAQIDTAEGAGGSGNAEGWSQEGNAVAANAFLGTTNWNPLLFKVNNTEMAQFHPNGGVTMGMNASANNNHGLALGSDSQASALNSVAIGRNASASAQNAVAIGKDAAATQANTVILGNTLPSSNWEATKVGIGVANPSEKVEVKGNVKISDGNLIVKNGSVQIEDGTQGAGKILTSDANGNASWQDLTIETAFVDMRANSSQSLNPWNAVNFGTTTLSENMNTSNNAAQVKVSGTYRVTYSVSVNTRDGGTHEIRFFLAHNNSSNEIVGSSSYLNFKKNETVTATASKIVHLDAWQQVSVFTNAPNNKDIETVADGTFLTVELIKAD